MDEKENLTVIHVIMLPLIAFLAIGATLSGYGVVAVLLLVGAMGVIATG